MSTRQQQQQRGQRANNYWWEGLLLWYNQQDYLSAMECWEQLMIMVDEDSCDAAASDGNMMLALDDVLRRLGEANNNRRNNDGSRSRDDDDDNGGSNITSSEQQQHFSVAPILLFLAGCYLDAREFRRARRCLLSCLRDCCCCCELENSSSNGDGNKPQQYQQKELSIIHRALSEWISSYEEEEGQESERRMPGAQKNGDTSPSSTTTANATTTSTIGYQVVRMALEYNVPRLSWTDPYQRPGFIYDLSPANTSSQKHKPVYDSNDFHWCRQLQNNPQLYQIILEEFWNAYHLKSQSSNSSFYPVGAGHHRDGAGQHDGAVVQQGGGKWEECVLFGAGAGGGGGGLASNSNAVVVAPKTRDWIARHVPEAVSLANAGGGEIIFSVLEPNTHIESHCAPTNLRLTAHLGIVVPANTAITTSDPSTASTTTDKGKCQCQIRVADQWLTWEEGKIIVFDDSYEHEVINSTNSIRVVLLFRFWHPSLLSQEKRHEALELALKLKRKESLRRYNPPPPRPPSCHRQRSSSSIGLRAMEESSCPNCCNAGYECIRVVPTDNTAATAGNADNDYGFACSCGQPI